MQTAPYGFNHWKKEDENEKYIICYMLCIKNFLNVFGLSFGF